MKQSLVLIVVSLLSQVALAQIPSGCGSQTIPAERSRLADRPILTCGGGTSEYTRRGLQPSDDDMDQWNYLVKTGNQEQVQKYFMDQPDYQWSGKIPYNVYVEWTWQRDDSGQSAEHCGTTDFPYQGSCSKEETDYDSPICANDAPPPSSNSGYGAGAAAGAGAAVGGGFGGGNNSGSASPRQDYSRPSAPAPRPAPLPKSHSESSYKRPTSGGGGGGGGRKSHRQAFFSPVAYRFVASGGCGPGQHVAGYHTKTITYACIKHNFVANSCHWNTAIHEKTLCQEQKLNYTVKFQKPDITKWNPKNPQYHPLIPMGYELLPGEWEKYTVVSNQNVSTVIHPTLDQPENAWNKYDIKTIPSYPCKYNADYSVNITVATIERIKRKSPNAFAFPVDRYGNKKTPLKQNSTTGIHGEINVPGEPYAVELEDSSDAVVKMGAKATRSMDPEAPPGEKVVEKGKSANFSSMLRHPFFKDTQIRVSLIEKDLLGRNIHITDNLNTTSALVNDGSRTTIPLMGENGVESVYHATGPFNFVMGWFWGNTTVHLTPGHNYQIRVAMYQRGIPFYESACKKANNCEGDKAKDSAFSDDLVVDFTADKRADERTWINKFRDWHEAPFWEKVQFWRF